MNATKIDIKPVSVNECWQGKRFKTNIYKCYEIELLGRLPKLILPPPPFMVTLWFGLSSSLADIDNPVKPFLDILQKKYNFNDKLIEKLIINKERVGKGKEFIIFEISTNK